VPVESLLRAAGPLRHAYESVDWAATPLGPIPDWSPALRGAVDLVLGTRFPSTLLWGPEFVLVYNDAYTELIAEKHPRALGRPAREIFPEIWDEIGPLMQAVLDGEGSTWVEDQLLPLERRGFLEDCFFTYGYSPVRGEDGAIEGVLDIAWETTRQVVDRRRLLLLGRLAAALVEAERTGDVREQALPILRGAVDDLPEAHLLLGGERPPELPGLVVLPLGRDATLAVRRSPHLPHDVAYDDFLRLLGTTLTQALDRVAVRESQRGLSEALQRSLLTHPLEPDHLELAVRYQPAAEEAQVGGDWYDSFLDPDGALVLVVGDVSGHDRRAAAAMAQVRNLLRGVAFTSGASPAGVLDRLDAAMQGLDVGAAATAVVARVEQTPEDKAAGRRLLRWSSAGHPPPVLVHPGGRVEVLRRPPGLLLGIGAAERTDHTVVLEPGSTLVLYTDGLVERRREAFDDRLEWLSGLLAAGHDEPAESLADRLVAAAGGDAEDDVALLVLRAHPE
jgi:serine phosphatase RsbU (regulator of sigma subunit)